MVAAAGGRPPDPEGQARDARRDDDRRDAEGDGGGPTEQWPDNAWTDQDLVVNRFVSQTAGPCLRIRCYAFHSRDARDPGRLAPNRGTSGLGEEAQQPGACGARLSLQNACLTLAQYKPSCAAHSGHWPQPERASSSAAAWSCVAGEASLGSPE